MFDKEAIQELQTSAAITQAAKAITEAFNGKAVVALPDDFNRHDLEPYLPHRRRAIGCMETESVVDFAAYVTEHAEEGASVFVNAENMKAVAVLNLGTPKEPGHADNLAKLTLSSTAAYQALKNLAHGNPLRQSVVAEFLEDWQDSISCYVGEEAMRNAQAIAAVRDITIENARKVESQEQQLSATRSALESVTASSKHTLPTHIYFNCTPYFGLQLRAFVLRLSIQTGGEKPAIVLRIVKQEEHDEAMAQEFSEIVRASLQGNDYQVYVGSYTKRGG